MVRGDGERWRPSRFDADFRRLAVPRLEGLARRLAGCVARGRGVGYARACDVLMKQAVRLGGVSVSDLWGLQDYLELLLADLIEAECRAGED